MQKKTNPLKTLSKNTNVQHEHVKKPHKQKHKSFAVRSANLYFPPHINVVGSDINGCYVLRCAVFYFLSTSSTFDESILIRSCFSWRLRMLNVVGFLWIFGSQSNTEVIHDAWDGGHTGAELRGSRGEICPILERHFSISVLSPIAPLSFWVKVRKNESMHLCNKMYPDISEQSNADRTFRAQIRVLSLFPGEEKKWDWPIDQTMDPC